MANTATAQPATGNPDIDGVLSGVRWGSPTITYNFPTSAAYYPADYNGLTNEPSGFVAASASFQAMVRDALAQYAEVANVSFAEVGPGEAADISVARTSSLGTFNGVGYNPSAGARGGDAWFASSTAQVGDTEVYARGTWRLVMHELGHSLGLKHAHEAGGPANTTVTPEHDDNDYSIMSYRRTPGGPLTNTAEAVGNPQSPMIYDIAAVQAMYGANYATRAGNTVYSWSPTTGQAFVDGAGQPAPGGNRVYETIWDGGGIDTYDLSNYATGLRIDLRPGAASTLSADQLAVTDTGTGARAAGNVFNALLAGGNPASLIENAVGGSGDDSLTGNDAANLLTGGSGNDTAIGGLGNDTAFGNQGSDVLFGNLGADVLYGGQGADALYGGQGDDLDLGNLGDDLVFGNLGTDTLYGGQGADTLYGGQDNDVLSGDLGDDVLSGDRGADRYVFGANSGTDLILGFNQADGDRLDLQGQSYTLVARADGTAQLNLSGGGSVILGGVTAAAFGSGAGSFA
ncbi:M10 family metallopeptidase [Methylobacterium sp. A54F]